MRIENLAHINVDLQKSSWGNLKDTIKYLLLIIGKSEQ